EFVADPLGTNVVVTRDKRIHEIIRRGMERGALWTKQLSVASVKDSQAAGLRHRREGLSHRLARRIENGLWVPVKRVQPHLAKGRYRRRIYDIRLDIAVASAPVFGEARRNGISLAAFEAEMSTRLERYRATIERERMRGLAGVVWRILSRWL